MINESPKVLDYNIKYNFVKLTTENNQTYFKSGELKDLKIKISNDNKMYVNSSNYSFHNRENLSSTPKYIDYKIKGNTLKIPLLSKYQHRYDWVLFAGGYYDWAMAVLTNVKIMKIGN